MTETTETVGVLDLAGQDVAGRRAQVRNPYNDPDWRPMWRNLKSVEIHTNCRCCRLCEGPWVVWTWTTESDSGYDCGFSGMTVALAQETGRALELVAA
jgi:hypothetical protein